MSMHLDGWEALNDLEASVLRMRRSGMGFKDIGKELKCKETEKIFRIASKKLEEKIKLNKALGK